MKVYPKFSYTHGWDRVCAHYCCDLLSGTMHRTGTVEICTPLLVLSAVRKWEKNLSNSRMQPCTCKKGVAFAGGASFETFFFVLIPLLHSCRMKIFEDIITYIIYFSQLFCNNFQRSSLLENHFASLYTENICQECQLLKKFRLRLNFKLTTKVYIFS